MKQSRNALGDRIGKRVDRTISKNKTSFDTWVNYHFEGIAKDVGRRMTATTEGRLKGSNATQLGSNSQKPKK